MLYPVTATSSVEASQVRSICEDETAVATRFSGTLGAWVSPGGSDPAPQAARRRRLRPGPLLTPLSLNVVIDQRLRSLEGLPTANAGAGRRRPSARFQPGGRSPWQGDSSAREDGF